jgi:hypothetical protein
MITWRDVVSYINAKYQVDEHDGDMIKLTFGTAGGRSQMVLLARHVPGGNPAEEWVQVASPIAPVNRVNVVAVLQDVSELICGGLAIYGDLLFIQDSFPLANMQANELERPLHLITASADRLERKHVGADVF